MDSLWYRVRLWYADSVQITYPLSCCLFYMSIHEKKMKNEDFFNIIFNDLYAGKIPVLLSSQSFVLLKVTLYHDDASAFYMSNKLFVIS